MSSMSLFSALAVVFLTAGNGAPPQPHVIAAPARVLVMPFAVEVDPDGPGGAAALWLGEAASVLVTDGLSALGVPALPRAERLAAFDRLDLPMTSTLTRATMIRVGELVGASAIIFGDVRLGASISVRARLVDIRAGREAAPVLEAADMADLFPLFDRITAGLAVSFGRVATPGAPTLAPLPLEVFENYAKGLVAATPEVRRRFLEAAMMKAPRDGRVLLEVWRVCTALGLPDKALEAASAVSADSPLARQARFAVAQSLIQLERLDGAFRELAILQAQQPSGVLANALGVVELRRNRTSSAAPVAYFEDATASEPGNTDFLFNLGYARALAGSPRDALGALREAVRLDVVDANAHLLMSALLLSEGRTTEAGRERALAASLGAEATDLRVLGDLPDRLERLPQDIELDAGPAGGAGRPGRADEQATAVYHLDRARALVEARRDREAAGELRRAIYLDPYANEPHLLLGLVYQRSGRLGESIEEFRVAIWAHETADAQVALGRALFEAGDREASKQAAERALRLDPGSVDARELLDRIGG